MLIDRSNRHCSTCAEFLELSQELDRLLGRKPWKPSVFSTVTAEPPDYVACDPQKSADWQQTYALRLELEAQD